LFTFFWSVGAMSRFARVLGLAVVGLIVGVCPVSFGARVDPFMGDWEGEGSSSDGESFEFAAQVIALGDGGYRINILKEFDVGGEPMHVMDGVLKEDEYSYTADGGAYTGSGVLDGDVFRGSYKGDVGGRFEMKRIERRSATLGAKPPKGSIVLFDGKNLDRWERMGGAVGIVDLAKIIGGDNVAAYIRTKFYSDVAGDAVLEVGSDDGVKVWVNAQVVHTNNASRGVKPGEDKINVSLNEGVNYLMLKVTNGGGGWGACVRFSDKDGKTLETISELKGEYGERSVTKENLKANKGFLTKWWVCGPYRVEGKSGPDLMDVEMKPEQMGLDAPWKEIEMGGDPKKARWIVKDGVMQVNDGSIRTKRNDFTDFKLHVEFKSPFMAKSRGQSRGNSGVYLQNRYEVQVLDSYGLAGLDNECGGVYKVGRPAVNMCAPPEQWQTYDIDFTAAKMVDGKRQPAVLTVEHNGVTIHNKIKIPGPTGGALDGNVLEPGGIYLQDHGNPVQFRNIWLVPKKQ
jgi:3-keto-disaccharide hydrolase